MKYLILVFVVLFAVGCEDKLQGEHKGVEGFDYVKGCLEGKEAIFYWSSYSFREVSFTGRDCAQNITTVVEE